MDIGLGSSIKVFPKMGRSFKGVTKSAFGKN